MKSQTVNLLALRLQWFESTPAHTSPRAEGQVFKLFGEDEGLSRLYHGIATHC